MTKEQELQEIRRYLWEEVDGYDLSWESDCDKLTEKLYKDGWHKQKESKWIPITKINRKYGVEVIVAYECSLCSNRQEAVTNYCSHCGARTRLGEE